MVDVSVIVIGYKDANRIGRAIESVQAQTLRDLEIIVVDDCSPDNTADVVAEYAKSDSRIRFQRLSQNTGSGSGPRNAGIAMATGTWVMFVDSDDRLERHACKNLLRAVEEADADMGVGLSVRIDTHTGRERPWIADLHAHRCVYESLIDVPMLAYSTLCTNKIFSREWLVDNEIDFEEGLFFQDQLFTLKAACLARRIAVIPEVVHLWSVDRISDELSVTNRRHEVDNVSHRIRINRLMDEFLVDRPDVRMIKDEKFVNHDLNLYLATISQVDDDTAYRIADQLIEYLQGVDLSAALRARPGLRIAIFHLLHRDIDGVRTAMMYHKWAAVLPVGIRTVDGRDLWDCSHADDPAASDWLDVTEMRFGLVPFSQFRFLATIDSVTDDVTAGRLWDPLGLVHDTASIECVLLAPGERVVASAPASTSRWEAGIDWKTSAPFEWYSLPSKTGNWGLRVWRNAFDGDAVHNVITCRHEFAKGLRGVVTIGNRELTLESIERGVLAWQPTGESVPVAALTPNVPRLPDVDAASQRFALDLPEDRVVVFLRHPAGTSLPNSLDLDRIAPQLGDSYYLVIDAGRRLTLGSRHRYLARDVYGLEAGYAAAADMIIDPFPSEPDELVNRILEARRD